MEGTFRIMASKRGHGKWAHDLRKPSIPSVSLKILAFLVVVSAHFVGCQQEPVGSKNQVSPAVASIEENAKAATLTPNEGAKSGPTPAQEGSSPASVVMVIPSEIVEKMKTHSWRIGCPLPLHDLAYVKIRHWGYDGKAHNGELIVHKDLSDEVVEIFDELLAAKFPIERIRLIDEYGGDDDKSMADNNTSGFNCRFQTGSTKRFSKHSLGRAIDLNPVANPYVSKTKVLPPAGKDYIDRTKKKKGMITAGGIAHRAFTKRGWKWGGAWRRSKDYQHFEK